MLRVKNISNRLGLIEPIVDFPGFYKVAILGILLIVLAACEQKTQEMAKPTEQRTDYSPEEFGIGRRHTPDRRCNREIDNLLNGIRLCYQRSGTSEKCERVQQQNNNVIKKLKNSVRCAS